MISQQNRQRIFRLCTLLGFDDDQRHELAQQYTGKESLTKMTDSDAGKFIRGLATLASKHGLSKGQWTAEKSIKRGTQRNTRIHQPNVYNLMSAEQREKIIVLSCHIFGEFDEHNMDKFCYRQFKKPFRQLSSDDAIKLIEIQKSMLERKIKKGAIK